MKLIIKWQYLMLCIILFSSVMVAQPAENPQTFCNPLNLNYRFMVDAVDAREAADPVIVLFKGDYYLFASRSGGYWTSTDLLNWTLIIPTGLDVETYAPAVIVMRDSLFYIPSATSRVYKSADPKSGIWESGPSAGSYGDPALFLDDDGHLYMYYGLSNNAPISVVELDPMTFKEIGNRINIFSSQANIHGWERRGDDNLLDEQPWIEGSWMIKHNDTYYLHYAAPGTEFKTYADGIYTASSPTGPFEYATYSPFAFKPTGFISGSGHGSTFKDKDGQYWHIATMTISIQHIFERRLGLSPVGFDADGMIHCNTIWGDYPQYIPGSGENMVDNSFAGMMLLSHNKFVMTSSSIEGHEPEKAVDEEVRTYWSAQSGGSDEWLMIDLGQACSVQAIQVNFAEHGTNPAEVRGRDNLLYQQYTIERSDDGINWDLLIDKSNNLKDVPHDYIELAAAVDARYIKLNNVFVPGGGTFAIRDLRIFGNSEKAVFTQIDDYSIQRDDSDGRDAVLRWSPVADADGYLIRYGIAADKLYNHYLVYDSDSVAIHSLNHGVVYYFEVEAFDNGTEDYRPKGEFQSFQSGNWNNVNSWARNDGSQWIHPAPNVPDTSDGVITILEGHTLTVTGNDTIDQLVVAAGGTLVINKNAALHIKNDVATDMMVEGIIINHGAVTMQPQATISFLNEGKYYHRQDGGSIPSATWRPNAACIIDSVKQTVPEGINQDFFNFNWNCPEQTGLLNMMWNDIKIGGSVTILNTGTGRLEMCAPGTGNAAVVDIKGDFVQSGGSFTTTGTTNANTTITINHAGNILVTGGNFSICRGSQGGSGTSLWKLTSGGISLTNCTTQNDNNTGAKFVFSGNDNMQTLSLSDVTYSAGGLPVEIDDGAILDIGTSVLEGDGKFTLNAGGMLITAHSNGLNGSIATTGTVLFNNDAGYGFKSTSAQVTGILIPGTVRNLYIDNGAGVTLSKNIVINGNLEMRSGFLSLGSYKISYGPEGFLTYSGSASQTTHDEELPETGGPEKLVVSNTDDLTLHASRTINTIELNGILLLGTNILTADSVSNASVNNYIETDEGGILKLNTVGASQKLFPVGTPLSYTPVWITNDGTVDTIGVSVTPDATPAANIGRVKVKWDILENTSGGGDYTLQFGWLGRVEELAFRQDRTNKAKIFYLTTMVEAGSGDYTMQFDAAPYTVSRAGIGDLGLFGVGAFGPLSADPDNSSGIPLKFSLEQNYPNPFNAATSIEFSIAKETPAKIIIYDLLGRKVATLVNKRLKPGIYSARWDAGKNASGIYIYKLITDTYVHARKMVLIK